MCWWRVRCSLRSYLLYCPSYMITFHHIHIQSSDYTASQQWQHCTHLFLNLQNCEYTLNFKQLPSKHNSCTFVYIYTIEENKDLKIIRYVCRVLFWDLELYVGVTQYEMQACRSQTLNCLKGVLKAVLSVFISLILLYCHAFLINFA